MRAPTRWLRLGLLVFWLGGCAAEPHITPSTYVVKPGDTLYSIAWRFDLNYADLAAWNGLGAGNRLEPGQMLWLRPTPAPSTTGPGVTARAPAQTVIAPSASAAPAREGAQVGRPRPLPDLPAGAPADARQVPAPAATAAAPATKAALSTPAASAAPPAMPASAASAATVQAEPLRWVWPTKALRRPVPVPGGGVLLLGAVGQDVLAAAPGRVVYVGEGIRGYGNLVIIKHSDTLLSAYAHNREVAVRENQQVRGGERIAAMGLGPRQIPALYFEIRVNGKPAVVQQYLH